MPLNKRSIQNGKRKQIKEILGLCFTDCRWNVNFNPIALHIFKFI